MKPQTQTLIAAVIVTSFSLIACDPGRKELNQVKDKYQEVIKDPTAKANVMQLPDLVRSLKEVAARNENHGSGKRAQDQLQEIVAKVDAKEASVKKEILMKATAALKADSALVKKAENFAALARTTWNEKKTPLRTNQCIVTPAATDTELPLFSSFQAFEIDTISAKRNTDGIAIQPLYRSSRDDTFRKSDYTRGQWQKHSIGMFAFGSIVNCNDIKNFSQDYLSTIDKVLEPYIEQYKEEILALSKLRYELR